MNRLLRILVVICCLLAGAPWSPHASAQEAAPPSDEPPPDPTIDRTPKAVARFKMGYIDHTGKYAIPPIYKFVKPFHEGRASVLMEGKGWGLIDKDGKYIIEPSYAAIGPFSEGLAGVCPSEKNLWKRGYIDRNGKQVIDFDFHVSYCGPFHNGRAKISGPYWLASQWMIIDKSGRILERHLPR